MALPELPSDVKEQTLVHDSNAIASPSMSLPRHGIPSTAEPKIDLDLEISQGFIFRTEASNARLCKLNALRQAKRSNRSNRDNVSDDEEEDELCDLTSFLLHHMPFPLPPFISVTSASPSVGIQVEILT